MTVRFTPTEGCTSNPISMSCAMTASIWASVARSFITMTMGISLIIICRLQPLHETPDVARGGTARGGGFLDDLNNRTADDRGIRVGRDLLDMLRTADSEAQRHGQ